MGKGGGGQQSQPANTTSTTTSEPWAEQKPFLEDIMGLAQSQYQGAGPEYFPTPTISPVDPLQTQAQENIINYLGGNQYSNLLASGQNTYNELIGANPTVNAATALAPYGTAALTGAMNTSLMPTVAANPALTQMLAGDPLANPYFNPAIEAMTNQMDLQYAQNTAPQDRFGMIQAGHLGGSTRGDIVQGLSLGGHQASKNQLIANMMNQEFQRAMDQRGLGAEIAEAARGARAEELTDQFGGAYDQALGAEAKRIQQLGLGLQQYPSIMAQPLQAQNVLSQIGAERRGFGQADIEEAIAQHNFEQNLEAAKLAQYHNLVSGNLGMSGTSTATGMPSGRGAGGGGAMGALGGALGGAGLYSAFGAGPMAFSNPYLLAAAGIGGLLGAFG